MNSSQEEIEHQVRQKLNEQNIKLWLAPYTLNGMKGEYPQEVVERFASQLGVANDLIATIIEKFRTHALEKLAGKQQFQECGIATLKIKLAGNLPCDQSDKQWSLESKLDITGLDLKKVISEKLRIATERLKVISCGQVIDDNTSLALQKVKHGSHVMVIYVCEEARAQDGQHIRLARTKEVAEMLAKRKEADHDEYYLQIADQTGKPIDLPQEERRSLSIALTLNERGRACLKRKQHAEALLILLEADKEFRQCRSEILSAVDNYAVLCLDIAWCYMCLQNIDSLPDAESRLKTCEDCFKRSYGENMERLQAVKGDSSRELVLYVRLYLLQGITAYYQYKKQLSLQLLNKAKSVMETLQVDDEKLSQLVGMGFSMCDARLGLRAANGHLEFAVTKISERKERRKNIAAKEKEEHMKKKMQRKLGKTAMGEWVNIDVYNTLISMGFPSSAAATSLKQSNNDINLALQTLQEHPDLLSLPDMGVCSGVITDEMLAQVCELGFIKEIAKQALLHYHGNVEKAVEILVANGGLLPVDIQVPTTSANAEKNEDCLTEQQEKALEELAPDIPDHEEDYLDHTLDEEARFIEEYQTKLVSMRD